MQPGNHVGVAGTKSRPKTDKDPGRNHRCQRVSKYVPIEAAIHSIAEVRRSGCGTDKSAARCESPLSDECNNQALGKHLPHDAPIARADGHSNGHLMFPAHGTCQ